MRSTLVSAWILLRAALRSGACVLAAWTDAGWSGGTRIGHAVRRLNEEHSAELTANTVVTIMSDGWDTGEAELLDREMARLSARVRAVVWMNPLKGDSRYEPLAQGMATALPYCKAFITGHSIASFGEYARLIAP